MDEEYGDLARDYEWLFGDEVVGRQGRFGATSPGSRELLEEAVGALRPGAAILDCACGIGADAAALADRGFAVTATDASAAMVAQARRRAAERGLRLTIRRARWPDLPRRAPGPFDLAVCLGNAIVHADGAAGRAAALAGIRQVLRPGGIVVVDSRNWELLHDRRPRIVPAGQVRERNGTRCVSLYIWTLPERFGDTCRAEIVLLFEQADGSVTHRRHVLDFRPFRHDDLTGALAAAGLTVLADSFRADSPFYAIAAAVT